MGIETADDEVRNKLLKRDLSKEQMLNACRLLRKYKIKVVTQNMLGLPTEDTLKKDLETLKFNIKLKPTYGWSSIFYPYPSTELYDYCVKNGYFDPENFTLESNKVTSPLNFDEKTKKEIVNLHKLFGITVKFPILYPLTRILIKLPLYKLYSFMYFAWYGYMYHIVIRPTKMNMKKMRDLFTTFLSFFKSLTDLKKTKDKKLTSSVSEKIQDSS